MEKTVRMKRPLFVTGVAFSVSLLTATAIGWKHSLLLAATGALVTVFVWAVKPLRRYEAAWAVALAAMTAFAVFAAREVLYVRPLQEQGGTALTVKVHLSEAVGRTEKSAAFYADVQSGELPPGTRILVWSHLDEDVPILYDTAWVTLDVKATDFYRRDNVYLFAWAQTDTWDITDVTERTVADRFHKWRQTVSEKVRLYIDGDASALVRAVCLGDRSALSDEAADAFAAAGLSHLTAVSGFHMSVVAWGVFGLLVACGVRRRRAALIGIPVLIAFVAITGFSHSAIRAGVMTLIIFAGELLRRRADAKNSLGAALILILTVDPNGIYDIGLQLSAACTWSVLFVLELPASPAKGGAAFGALHKVRTMLRISIAATVVSMPILAMNFGSVPLVAPVSNLLGEPAASAIVVAGCIGLVLAWIPFAAPLARVCFLVGGVCAEFLLWWSQAIAARFSPWVLDRPYLIVWACILPGVLWFGCRMIGRKGLRVTAAVMVLVLAVSAAGERIGMRDVTVVTATDIYSEPAVLLRKNGQSALILINHKNADAVKSYLDGQGVDRLDLLVYNGNEKTEIATDVRRDTLTEIETEPLLSSVQITLWREITVDCHDRFMLLNIANSRVLICFDGADVQDLSPDERQAPLVIYAGALPQNVTALSVGSGIFCGEETEDVLWIRGRYPVIVTNAESVSAATRGNGDFKIQWLTMKIN